MYSSPDLKFWSHTKDGIYSVKSGYWLGVLGRLQATANDNSELWNLVWNMGGPPKLSHFVWQAYRGRMAVKEVLFRRHVAQDELCVCCGVEVESINHVLFECSTAEVVWDESGYKAIVEAAPSGSFEARLRWWVNKVGTEEVRRIMTIAWAIWFIRNKFVHDGECVSHSVTTSGFLRMVDDYRSYAKSVFSCPVSHNRTISTARWSPPPMGIVKVNVDAHVIGGVMVGMGTVIRDHEGKLLVAATKRLRVDWTAEMAEVAAARQGLLLARRLGYDKVWLECDALNVVRAIDKEHEGASPILQKYTTIAFLPPSPFPSRSEISIRDGNG